MRVKHALPRFGYPYKKQQGYKRPRHAVSIKHTLHSGLVSTQSLPYFHLRASIPGQAISNSMATKKVHPERLDDYDKEEADIARSKMSDLVEQAKALLQKIINPEKPSNEALKDTESNNKHKKLFYESTFTQIDVNDEVWTLMLNSRCLLCMDSNQFWTEADRVAAQEVRNLISECQRQLTRQP